MNNDVVLFAVIFVAVILLQVLILNHIMLFNVAFPFVFIFFLIRLPLNMHLNWLYTLAFLLGFIVDVFSDTPGLNSLSCLIFAAVKKPVFYLYVPRDDKTVNIMPCLSSLGWSVYTKFLITMTAIYCLVCFSIEYFSFASVKEILILSVCSTVLSFLLVLACDSLVVTNRERL